jgi:hypothetical protein
MDFETIGETRSRAWGNPQSKALGRVESRLSHSDGRFLPNPTCLVTGVASGLVYPPALCHQLDPCPTTGFTTARPAKRLKSRSADHSSRTPCCRHKATMRASWT